MTSSIAKLILHNNFSAESFDNVPDDELQDSGYNSTKFAGKKDQLEKVKEKLSSSGFIPKSLIDHEADWFYNELDIDDAFFAAESVDSIASHILSLYSSKVASFARGVKDADPDGMHFHHETIAKDGTHAAYFALGPDALQLEQDIDDKFLDKPAKCPCYRLISSVSTLNNGNKLHCAFVYRCSFPDGSDKTNFTAISDKTFNQTASKHTKSLYAEVLKECEASDGPVVKHYAISASGEQRIMIGYLRNSSPRYSSSLSVLADYYGVNLKRKFVENFANGYSVVTMFIEHSENYTPEQLISKFTGEASLLYCIPHDAFYKQFAVGDMSVEECIFAHCGLIFVTHFLNRLGPEFSELKKVLPQSTKNLELLSRLKDRLTSETYTPEFIHDCIECNGDIVKCLFKYFVEKHYPGSKEEKQAAYCDLGSVKLIKTDDDFKQLIEERSVTNPEYGLIFEALYSFSKSILETNFFITSKLAISFKLKPTFLPKEEYPNTPFGMFFVVGSDFRGFHIRFRDIARGGIRIVKSRSLDAYNKNRRTMFDENYGLASTQQRKNKDIPEGGSKGVILLDYGKAQNKVKDCFEKYIDALLDILVKDPALGKIVDLYGKPEMLFMGPDENTANLVDWATLHAKKRGAKLGFPWKAFFTGKSPEIGGIPHDAYGMTTLSIRSYVEGTYKKLGITDWSKINKLQMAGGDGDLGSNEIKLSGDEKYVGLVDGYGCIVDEDGIDKEELKRLADKRLGNDHFDKSKLGPKGYAIMVDDKNVKLPNGKVIQNGVLFRNDFHLLLPKIYPRKDFINLFVPCGGRPASINANNVHCLLDEKTGKSLIPIIIEGANLFITQAAKIILEKAGAIVFKDASTNKGGVTSSSMEVLAALSFDDEGFKKNMCIDPVTKEAPEFYKQYVKEDQQVIVRNAQAEFSLLWKLKDETHQTFSELSDELSVAINTLGDQLRSCDELYQNDTKFRKDVVSHAIPPILLKTLGIETIMKNVPEAYLKAVFATKLASEYVYTRGIDPNPAKFLEYISALRKEFKE